MLENYNKGKTALLSAAKVMVSPTEVDLTPELIFQQQPLPTGPPLPTGLALELPATEHRNSSVRCALRPHCAPREFRVCIAVCAYIHVLSVPLGPMPIPKTVSMCSAQKPISTQDLTLLLLPLTLQSVAQNFPSTIGGFRAYTDLRIPDPNTNFPIPT